MEELKAYTLILGAKSSNLSACVSIYKSFCLLCLSVCTCSGVLYRVDLGEIPGLGKSKEICIFPGTGILRNSVWDSQMSGNFHRMSIVTQQCVVTINPVPYVFFVGNFWRK